MEDDDREHADWLRFVPPGLRELIPAASGSEADVGVSDWRRYVPAAWRHLLEVSPAPRPQGRSLRFVGVDEERPGRRWRELFAETWPAYRSWWLSGDAGRRPDAAEARAALHRHMPEL